MEEGEEVTSAHTIQRSKMAAKGEGKEEEGKKEEGKKQGATKEG